MGALGMDKSVFLSAGTDSRTLVYQFQAPLGHLGQHGFNIVYLQTNVMDTLTPFSQIARDAAIGGSRLYQFDLALADGQESNFCFLLRHGFGLGQL